MTDAERGGVASASGSAPRPFSELDRRGRILRGLAIAFTVYHLGAMLVGGSVAGVKKIFRPLVGFYGDGLRMTNSWGMFGKPPGTTHVVVEGVLKGGQVVTLSTTRAQDRSLWERIRDVRVRKIQGKLTDGGDRARFGHTFLAYFCEEGRATYGKDLTMVRAQNHVHELRDDAGNVTRRPSERLLLARNCDDPSRAEGRRPSLAEELAERRRKAAEVQTGDDAPSEGGDL